MREAPRSGPTTKMALKKKGESRAENQIKRSARSQLSRIIIPECSVKELLAKKPGLREVLLEKINTIMNFRRTMDVSETMVERYMHQLDQYPTYDLVYSLLTRDVDDFEACPEYFLAWAEILENEEEIQKYID